MDIKNTILTLAISAISFGVCAHVGIDRVTGKQMLTDDHVSHHLQDELLDDFELISPAYGGRLIDNLFIDGNFSAIALGGSDGSEDYGVFPCKIYSSSDTLDLRLMGVATKNPEPSYIDEHLIIFEIIPPTSKPITEKDGRCYLTGHESYWYNIISIKGL